jgi:hypothetical protein
MNLISIDNKHFNLDRVVEIKHVNAPSGQSDNITTDIVFDFTVGNEPYKIHINKPVSFVLEAIKPYLPK